MYTRTSSLAAGVGSLIVAGAAGAGEVDIRGLDDGFRIESASMSQLFEGSTDHGFVDPDVRSVHEMLHAAGIATEAHVTFVLLDTSLGLSFVTLVDDHSVHGDFAASLALVTDAPSTAEYWVNDLGGDMTDADSFTEGGITTAQVDFRWIRGDGFSWTGLEAGDDGSFVFSPSGLTNNLTADNPYQFVSPGEDGWDVVWSGDYAENGELAFEFEVAGVPSPGALALLGLAGMAGLGRRRRG